MQARWQAIGFRAFNKCPIAGARMEDVIHSMTIWSNDGKSDRCVPNSQDLKSRFTESFQKDLMANHTAFSTHNLLFPFGKNLPLIRNCHALPAKARG